MHDISLWTYSFQTYILNIYIYIYLVVSSILGHLNIYANFIVANIQKVFLKLGFIGNYESLTKYVVQYKKDNQMP